jgi:alpha-1,2-mannosyltransferase
MTAASSNEAGRPARHLVAATFLICGVFGLLAWAFDLWFFRVAPLQDWMVFYEAARAFFDGNLSLIFDGNALTAAINQRFASWLVSPLGPHPWVYPPPMLLLILPFGLLAPAASVAVFLLAGFAAASLIVWRKLDAAARWPALATLALCPAVPFNVMTGQNAFYTVALLVGGFAVVAEQPILCGVLVGCLSLKPQLALVSWVALLAMRQWRALAAAMVTGLLLALVSLLVLGVDIWVVWSKLVLGGDGGYESWIKVGRLNGISVYACATWLGAPAAVASVAQAVATLGAGAMTYWVYRRATAPSLRLAVLLAATILAAPHASNSDAILLGLAAMFFVTAIPRGSLHPYQLTIAAAVWISPLFNPPVLFRIGCATPLLVAMLLAAVAIELRRRRAAALSTP